MMFEYSRSVSLAPSHQLTWQQFRDAFAPGGILCAATTIYRGHSSDVHELRTSLSRKGRLNLHRYLTEDLNEVARRIEEQLRIKFRLTDDRGRLALIGLGRHYGFPTPMLDWTRSPFVAAYFAFANTTEAHAARVFALDRAFGHSWPHPDEPYEPSQLLSPMAFGAVAPIPLFLNARAHRQQALAVYTNMFDVGEFLGAVKPGIIGTPERAFLSVIDLPGIDRTTALRDLSTMGISHDTLFPNMQPLYVSELQTIFGRATTDLFG